MRWMSMAVLAACAGPVDSGDGPRVIGGRSADDTGGGLVAGFQPDPTCDYATSGVFAASCERGLRTLRELSSWDEEATCPTFYDVERVRGIDPTDTLEAAGCEVDCVWTAEEVVDTTWCGRAARYVVYEPGGPGQVGSGADCGEVVHVTSLTGIGWARSWEAYQGSHPCPG